MAVANALPMLKREADRVSVHAAGDAVIELIDELLALDPAGTPPRSMRRRLLLGTRADGELVQVPTAWTTVLVTGPPGSGRSPLATGLLERVCAQGYQACVIDPDGRYGGFADAIVFGTPERAPTADEVLTALEQPEATAIVSLAAVRREARPAFVAELAPRLAALRASAGRPHWIVVDEAHELLATAEASEALAAGSGVIYVTADAAAMPAAALAGIDAVIALGAAPQAALAAVAAAAGRAAPALDGARRGADDALVWLTGAGEAVWISPVRAAPAEDRRHRRQPAAGELPPERSFYFRGPDSRLNLRAQSLPLFLQLAEGVDEGTWTHHLARGDYSSWLRTCVEDDALADEVAAVERTSHLAPRESRARVRAALEGRYELGARRGGQPTMTRRAARSAFARLASAISRLAGVLRRGGRGARVGADRPAVRVRRYVAARDQHWYHDGDLPDGVPDPEHAEPRRRGGADQARRAHPRRGRRAGRAARRWTTRRSTGCTRGMSRSRNAPAPRAAGCPNRTRRSPRRRAGGGGDGAGGGRAKARAAGQGGKTK